MSDPIRRTLPATTTGGYLYAPAARPGPAPLLVGFHGYGESAEAMLAQLARIPGASDCIVVSVQALHRFYNTKTGAVVGSWMTRLDREQAMADNARYVSSVLEAVAAEEATDGTVVFAGFSQGTAMAYRAAARVGRHGLGVIALAGDVPPDVEGGLPPVLIGRGTTDEWYTESKLAIDLARLGAMGVPVEAVRFEGAHEWTDAFVAAAGTFLARVLHRS